MVCRKPPGQACIILASNSRACPGHRAVGLHMLHVGQEGCLRLAETKWTDTAPSQAHGSCLAWHTGCSEFTTSLKSSHWDEASLPLCPHHPAGDEFRDTQAGVNQLFQWILKGPGVCVPSGHTNSWMYTAMLVHTSLGTYCVRAQLILQSHRHGCGPASEQPPPLTSQQSFSYPQASGGPSILLGPPPGLPERWNPDLSVGNRSSR